MIKHKDFLSHVKATHPRVHAKIVSHPDFKRIKHNSLHGAMKLDGAMTQEECHELLDSIFGAADAHGASHAKDLMFRDDDGPGSDMGDALGEKADA